MDQLDDQRGYRPRHNESDVEVRCGKVGTRRNVGDEGGGGKNIRNAWKRHGYEWFVNNAGEQDVGGNTKLGPRKLFKSLSHISLSGNFHYSEY